MRTNPTNKSHYPIKHVYVALVFKCLVQRKKTKRTTWISITIGVFDETKTQRKWRCAQQGWRTVSANVVFQSIFGHWYIKACTLGFYGFYFPLQGFCSCNIASFPLSSKFQITARFSVEKRRDIHTRNMAVDRCLISARVIWLCACER